MKNSIIAAWTNFAKYGDPTPPDSDLPSWLPITQTYNHHYWNITGSQPEMGNSIYIQDRMALWEEIWGVNDATNDILNSLLLLSLCLLLFTVC